MRRLEVQWEGQVDGELNSRVVSAENYGCCVSFQTSQTADDQPSDLDHVTYNGRLSGSLQSRQIVDSCSSFYEPFAPFKYVEFKDIKSSCQLCRVLFL